MVVPNLLARGLEEARQAIADAQLVPGSVTVSQTQQDPTDPAVKVLQQTPLPGASVSAGSGVSLVVSRPRDGDRFLRPNLTDASVESPTSAQAYYDAIDPLRAKTTLQAWKTSVAFAANETGNAVYVNDTDLGFGRRMHVSRSSSRLAFYVDNYGSLEDAIADRSLLATVAMEYGPGPAGSDPNSLYTQFYAFNGAGNRVLEVDLDGRGARPMPGLCLTCHGGRLPVFGATPSFPVHGDLGANFIPFDLDSLLFSSSDPRFTRAAQEASFRILNEAVRDTYARTFAFRGPPVAIPDGNLGGIDIPIDVAGLTSPINFLDVSFDGRGIQHKYISELEVRLRDPAGLEVTLFRRPSLPGSKRRLVTEIPILANALYHTTAMDRRADGRLVVVDSTTVDQGGGVGVGTARVYAVEPTTGETEELGVIPGPLELLSAAVTPDGAIYAADTTAIYRLRPAAGAFDLLAYFPEFLVTWGTLASDGAGGLLAFNNNAVYRFNSATATFTPLSQGGLLRDLGTLDVDGAGRIYALTCDLGAAPILVRIDAATGQQTQLPLDWPLLGSQNLPRVAVAPDGTLFIGDSKLFLVRADGSMRDASLDFSVDGGLLDPGGFEPLSEDRVLVQAEGFDSASSLETSHKLLELSDFGGANLEGSLFEDTTLLPLAGHYAGEAPYPAIYRSDGLLSQFRLRNPNGRWIVRVIDAASGHQGAVHEVALQFGQNAKAQPSPVAAELIEGWHGGRALVGNFDGTFLPRGWQPPAAPPQASALYHTVVARSCRLCHTQLDRTIDFSEHGQFVALGARHKRLIYEEGVMPLSLRSYDRFWLSALKPNRPTVPFDATFYVPKVGEPVPSPGVDQARFLAEYLAEIPASETRLGPGRPIADAGSDPRAESGKVVVLDGRRSLFSTRFQWSQVSGPTVALTGADTALAQFTAPAGETQLEFRLTVSSGGALGGGGLFSSADTVLVNVTAAKISYTTEIHPIWQARGCASCHRPPAFPTFDLSGSAAATYLAASGKVNLAVPEQSRLLLKPLAQAAGGLGHAGGAIFASTQDPDYLKILQWVREGAKKD